MQSDSRYQFTRVGVYSVARPSPDPSDERINDGRVYDGVRRTLPVELGSRRTLGPSKLGAQFFKPT